MTYAEQKAKGMENISWLSLEKLINEVIADTKESCKQDLKKEFCVGKKTHIWDTRLNIYVPVMKTIITIIDNAEIKGEL